ncbi:hypothetical protein [Sphingomonas jaspsi]|uniref:DUF4376 domain-containing protein n=1 Tax=Sphingomonas jaspsi TaxID=392409 RepID=UPI0004BCA1C8|nr:hypothetical protein [Sphingomonas jaspsi]
MSTMCRTLINPTYDRAWIAKQAGIPSYAETLDEEGFWVYSASDAERAMEIINDYPVLYLAKAGPEAKKLIEARAAKAFLDGFEVSQGPLAGHRLQCRDAEDRTNWLSSQVSYSAAIGLGLGDEPGATFRTAANETLQCTYREGSAVLLAMGKWGAGIMGRAWQLKDQVKSAGSLAELQLVIDDIDNGWPTTAAV